MCAPPLERAQGRREVLTDLSIASPLPRPGPALVLDHITKRFAGHTAVDDLSLSVPPGVIYGLLGPNGAGKTSTIRMMLGILLPDSGRVGLFGGSGTARDYSARIGYLPEERGLYRRMRVLDVLVFLGEMKGVDRRRARARALEWLDRLGLSGWHARRVDDLSKGMQQKVQFISTLLHDPTLVILDEPFAGLDPVNAQVLKDAVLDLRNGGATCLTVHARHGASRKTVRPAVHHRTRSQAGGRHPRGD